MKSSIFQSSLLYLATILFLSIFFPRYVCGDYEGYSNCSSTFNCGNITNIGYPFWGNGRPDYCGHPNFTLECYEDNTTINIMSQTYHVIDINQDDQVLKIVRMDYLNSICPSRFVNHSLDTDIFTYTMNDQYATLVYDCDPSVSQMNYEFPCPRNNMSRNAYFVPILDSQLAVTRKCNISIVMPILGMAVQGYFNNTFTIGQVIEKGFEVKWIIDQMMCRDCISSGGKCGYNLTVNEFSCFCRDQASSSRSCHTAPGPGSQLDAADPPAAAETRPDSKRRLLKNLAIGVSSSGLLGILLICIIFCCYKRMKSSTPSMAFFRKITKNDKDLEEFIRSYGTLSLQRYNFSRVKKMTNSFKDKLGQGGFGGVYKGKLLDGRLVAVKVLNASKGNGEEFINEVASISRTSHVNIVTLLGFCLEGPKRALVYEFMPNGSLEKYINNDIMLKGSYHLGWEKLYQIAIGVARGLEYLHRGCNTRILHFDIKPHNILLDEDFCPKISDFGLAKLCTKKESIISMLEARGTIGYIAPELFSRNFGGVSYKSDVYSYGMMVLDMVGGRKNIDAGVNHSSETYFPHWVYKRLELGTEFDLHGGTTGDETEIVRKMTLVGLWCIQTKPSERPSMSKVIEMLESSVVTLEIPPRPFLSSPPRSLPRRSLSDFSTISLS